MAQTDIPFLILASGFKTGRSIVCKHIGLGIKPEFQSVGNKRDISGKL
jgi:hypothetical protein